MNELHRLWPEQCAAARTIERNFGQRQALDYLVGEKLLQFIREARRHAEFADELPAFAAAVRGMFTREALTAFIEEIERRPARRIDDDPVWAAEEVLAVERARAILLD